MKKNILFVSATSEIGGADLSLLDIIRSLNPNLFNRVVVFPFEGPMVSLFRDAGAKVLICNTGYIRRDRNIFKLFTNFFRMILSVYSISRIIKRFDIDLVHSNSSIVFGGALAAKICGVKHIWHVREIKTTPKTVAYLIKLLIVLLSDSIVAISDAVKRSFAVIPDSDYKIRKINDGVDLKVFYPREKSPKLLKELKIKEDSRVIGAIGLILPLKGYEYFLHAAELVVKELPDTVFMIVGDNVIARHERYKNKLKNMVVALGLSKNVIFTGMRQDIPEIISIMDLSILASVEPEGMGRVILESMAMGKPVITTDLGGQSELVKDAVNGLLVPPRDSLSLAKGIIDLLKDSGRLKVFSDNARNRALEFNLVNKVKDLENIFLSLC